MIIPLLALLFQPATIAVSYPVAGTVACDAMPRGPGPVQCHLSTLDMSGIIPKPVYATWATLTQSTAAIATWCVDVGAPRYVPSLVRGTIRTLIPGMLGMPPFMGDAPFEQDMDPGPVPSSVNLGVSTWTYPHWMQTAPACGGSQAVAFAPSDLNQYDTRLTVQVRVVY